MVSINSVNITFLEFGSYHSTNISNFSFTSSRTQILRKYSHFLILFFSLKYHNLRKKKYHNQGLKNVCYIKVFPRVFSTIFSQIVTEISKLQLKWEKDRSYIRKWSQIMITYKIQLVYAKWNPYIKNYKSWKTQNYNAALKSTSK
jgi:hypothetical protein